MSVKKPIVLVDGSSYLFRAFHALPPLTNSQGVPTGAVYGVLNMLKKLIKEYEPEYFGVVFDPKGKTFRNDLYSEYKANRIKMPDELRVQIQPLFDAIKALGYPLIIEEGVEADDVIGTLAVEAEKKGYPVVISTGDKDMAQLVNDKITLVNTMMDRHMDITGVKEKFGVSPEQIIDYLVLIGDTSDNIPGVQKVGPKTAAKWLAQYNTLDNIIEHAQEITGKVGENLRAHLNEIPLTRELVTIKLDVDMDLDLNTLKPANPDQAKLEALFKELEFRKWLEQLQQESGAIEQKAKEYDIILDKDIFAKWISKLKKAKEFSFDTETTDLNPMAAHIVGVSFADKAHNAAYVPLAHDYMGAPKQLDKERVLTEVKALLADKNKTLIGQNLKYDIKVLRNVGIEIKANMFDTMLESYVLNSTSPRHDMDSLSLKYLGEGTIKFEDVAGKGAKQLTFNQIDLADAGPYATEDADVTLRLHQTLYPKIAKEKCYKDAFTNIEMPLMPILADMEYTGVLIDAELLHKQSKMLAKRTKQLEQEAYTVAGEEFNLGSPKQLQAILFEKLVIPVIKKTPKGQPSTAEAVLQELALDYPLPKLILEYRSLSKLKSTYTDKLPQQINPKTGRVHTSYNQAVTTTGRLSSTDPNLQNIPVRTEQGRAIRKAFIAPAKHKIVAADYSQIELRLMAHFSQDPGLVDAFKHNLDVHSSTAAEVFGVKLADVTPELRRRAKAINFGLMYGMSAFGVSRQLGISREEAQQHMDVYFKKYPNVHGFMEQTRTQAATKGYVETLLGRRLMIPDINASNAQRRMGAERAAVNAPLQGTAAEIIKIAMICIDNWLKESDIDVIMIMQVHDELIFEVADSSIDAACKKIKECMEGAVKLSVPLLVDVGVGDNWDQAH